MARTEGQEIESLLTMLRRAGGGEPITRAALSRLEGRRRDRLIDDVAQFLVELHAAPVGDDVRASPASKSHSAWLQLRDRAAETVAPLMWRHQREWLSELFRRSGPASCRWSTPR